MSRWLVELEGRMDAQIEVEADSEEEALAIAQEQGLPDLSFYHELSDFRAVAATEIGP